MRELFVLTVCSILSVFAEDEVTLPPRGKPKPFTCDTFGRSVAGWCPKGYIATNETCIPYVCVKQCLTIGPAIGGRCPEGFKNVEEGICRPLSCVF